MQSGCNQESIRMKSEGKQDATRMQSGGDQLTMRRQSRCNQEGLWQHLDRWLPLLRLGNQSPGLVSRMKIRQEASSTYCHYVFTWMGVQKADAAGSEQDAIRRARGSTYCV